jgi:preprotein translocase subunit SecB|nr:MAG TPA: Preprotein translocase subunit SecB [Caudoviricetes sp.]
MSQNIENKLKEKYPSPLKMDNLSILDAQIHFDPDSNENKLSISVKKDVKINKGTIYNGVVTLTTELCSESNSAYIKVVCRGKFSVAIDNLNEQTANMLIEKNTIAIMFPYVRSYISTITSIPNMSPIVLPPINVNKLIEDQAINKYK